jgi:hypothetical protein
MTKRVTTLVVSVIVLGGCATVSPVQLGQTAGMLVGGVAAPGVGAPLGTVIGTLMGLVLQKQVDMVTEKRERKQLTEQLGSDPGSSRPSTGDTLQRGVLPQGEPVRVWVDEAAQGGRVLAGHFEQRVIE